MAVTYSQIATATITDGSSTITLSSIPSGYTDLKLILHTYTSGTAAVMNIYFNGVNTGTSYGWQSLRRSATSVTTAKNINQAQFVTDLTVLSTNYIMLQMDLFNYTDTNSAKQVQWSFNAPSTDTTNSASSVVSGQYSSSSAITSITFNKSLGGFVNPTVVSLYGILRA